MRGRNLTGGSIRHLSWSLAWPVMLSIFFHTLYQLVDAFWVSRISDAAIAAVTVSQITLFVMISLTIGITVGSGVLMATCIGRRDLPEAERILGQSFVLNILAAAFFTAMALAFRRPLLTLTGATGDILPLALEYFTIVTGGSVLVFVFFAVIFGFNSQGDNTTVTWLFAISTTLNAILDPLLIFGELGLPAMGVRGAAVATILSQVVLVVAGVTLLKVRNMLVRFRFRNLVLRWRSVRQVLKIGFPAALTNMLNPAGLAVLNKLVALTFLEAGVVGLSIGFRIEFFSFLPAIGFGVAALALIGQNLGGGRLDRARLSWRTNMLAAFALGSLVGLGAVAVRGLIVQVFTADPLVIAYGRSYLITVPFTYGVVGALFVIVSAFQAMGKSWRGFAVYALRVGIMLGAALLVTRGPGTAGQPAPIVAVWLAIVAANLIAFAFGYLLLRRTFARLPAVPPPRPGRPQHPHADGAPPGAVDNGAPRPAAQAADAAPAPPPAPVRPGARPEGGRSR